MKPTIFTLAAFAQLCAFGQYPIDPCCAMKPSYTAPGINGTPGNFAQGQIAAATMWARGKAFFPTGKAGPMPDQDLVIWNIAPKQVGWSFLNPAPNTDWAPSNAYYSDPRWNYQNLGDVFGMVIDDKGNIYVSATSIYGFNGNNVPRIGGLAVNSGNSHGQIYKIANGTGTPTLFAQLPNPNGAGLGAIAFDCLRQRFFVSNFDDGLIYTLDTNGAVVGTFDHGAKLAIPITGQDYRGFAKYGRRPWAVRSHVNRLYYSIWNMDDLDHYGSTPNQIWSIVINPNGNPVGAATLELSVPVLSANVPWSNPVSDVTFSPTNVMFIAERSMQGDTTTLNHNSRVLSYNFTGTSWTPTVNTYSVGCQAGYVGYPANASGGVDLDLTPNAKVQVWATGDMLHRIGYTYPDNVFGLQGFPLAGGTVANSTLIDLDNNTATSHTAEVSLGVVRIPCKVAPPPPPPPSVNPTPLAM